MEEEILSDPLPPPLSPDIAKLKVENGETKPKTEQNGTMLDNSEVTSPVGDGKTEPKNEQNGTVPEICVSQNGNLPASQNGTNHVH